MLRRTRSRLSLSLISGQALVASLALSLSACGAGAEGWEGGDPQDPELLDDGEAVGETADSLVAGTTLSAGLGYTCYGRYCWGANTNGQLGTGDQLERLGPAEVRYPTTGTITSQSVG